MSEVVPLPPPLWAGEGWRFGEWGRRRREEAVEGLGCHWCASDKGRGRRSAGGKGTKRAGGWGQHSSCRTRPEGVLASGTREGAEPEREASQTNKEAGSGSRAQGMGHEALPAAGAHGALGGGRRSHPGATPGPAAFGQSVGG